MSSSISPGIERSNSARTILAECFHLVLVWHHVVLQNFAHSGPRVANPRLLCTLFWWKAQLDNQAIQTRAAPGPCQYPIIPQRVAPLPTDGFLGHLG
jgi:hypothetical protein